MRRRAAGLEPPSQMSSEGRVGARRQRHLGERREAALVGDRLAGPEQPHDLDRLLGPRGALRPRDADGARLGLRRDAEAEGRQQPSSESASIVASSLARMTAFRAGATRTLVPSLSFVVRAAAAASATSGAGPRIVAASESQIES